MLQYTLRARGQRRRAGMLIGSGAVHAVDGAVMMRHDDGAPVRYHYVIST